jgi:hypothetical protein
MKIYYGSGIRKKWSVGEEMVELGKCVLTGSGLPRGSNSRVMISVGNQQDLQALRENV